MRPSLIHDKNCYRCYSSVMSTRVLVAMSGGVDSSVTAFLMQKEGFDCTGVMMKLFGSDDIGESGGKTCCSLSDSRDARNVALKLGIPFFVYNFSDAFREQVIERFVESYQMGLTPNPCIDCNRYIKFNRLLERAEFFDFDYIATGHYAQIEKDISSGRYLLKKGVYTEKDQSYVLYMMTQNQLAHTLFPLGHLTKPEVRVFAKEQGFTNAHKAESQDICFVPNGDYADFIERHTGKVCAPGFMTDTEGAVLGEHKGILRYTIGQRRGIGVSTSGPPLYVCSTCVKTNTVVLGTEKNLFSRSLTAADINLIPFEKIDKPLKVKAKIRYRQVEQSATVEQTGENTVHVEFDQPQRAITKGQALVMYDGDIVVGGGTII